MQLNKSKNTHKKESKPYRTKCATFKESAPPIEIQGEIDNCDTYNIIVHMISMTHSLDFENSI